MNLIHFQIIINKFKKVKPNIINKLLIKLNNFMILFFHINNLK